MSDAKGQRQSITCGNGTATAYTYDPLTFRLARLVTTRTSPAATLQDLSYTYDPIGNITEIVDAAQQTVFFDNGVASPSMEYAYDAVYRLIYAEGREHAGLIGDDQRDERDLPIHALPHANDMSAVRRYEETYEYDAVGNFLSLAHVAVGNSSATWTRRYKYEPYDDNGTPRYTDRLHSTSIAGDSPSGPYSAAYDHDTHGNITAMPHLTAIDWDPLDQMQRADLGGGGEVFFTYDGAGQRVRKYRKHIGTLVEERIYLGSFELYRKRSGSTLQVERETLHVMDGVRRVAMIETKTVDTSVVGLVPTPRYRFQLGNHLETAHLEVDDTGLVISYEEMHPYGTSAYRSAASAVEVSARRYRYTGKERDDETGLDYFGARYYASWLGRWVSADPLGVQAGINLYLYCRAGPVVLTDPEGLAPDGFNIGENRTKATAEAVEGLKWGATATAAGALMLFAGALGGMNTTAPSEPDTVSNDPQYNSMSDAKMVRTVVIENAVGGLAGRFFSRIGVGVFGEATVFTDEAVDASRLMKSAQTEAEAGYNAIDLENLSVHELLDPDALMKRFSESRHTSSSEETLSRLTSGRTTAEFDATLAAESKLGTTPDAGTIKINPSLSMDEAVATIAHEGQHAQDIANGVVIHPSLLDELAPAERMGEVMFAELRAWSAAGEFAKLNNLTNTQAFRIGTEPLRELAITLTQADALADIPQSVMDAAMNRFQTWLKK